MNLFLIGYRCTGKTTVGQTLAQRLEWTFVDTDRMIEEAAGTTIAHLVDDNGWPFFREKEHEALAAACERQDRVIATGGGIILDPRNVAAMKNTGCVVWMTASETIIHERLLADETTASSRPPLTDQGLLEEIKIVLKERTPLYAEAADLVIDTDRATVEEICSQIVAELK